MTCSYYLVRYRLGDADCRLRLIADNDVAAMSMVIDLIGRAVDHYNDDHAGEPEISAADVAYTVDHVRPVRGAVR